MASLNTQFPPRFTLSTRNQKEIAKPIRDALEEHGCIVLKCEDREYFSDDMMVAMENFFNLDPEIKAKNPMKVGHHITYFTPNEMFPYYEAVSVLRGRAVDEEAQKFTRLMWPDGNDKFCNTLSSTGKNLYELAQTIMDIIVTSYGLGKEAMSPFTKATSFCRMSKYFPPNKGEEGLGLLNHVDGSYISILCQNEIHGLKMKSKDGKWLDVSLEKGSFIVFVGELLKAWSNGKLMAPEHKVMVSGEKDRYSFALFMVPEDDDLVEVESKMVDKENPARYKPFLYKDFYAFSMTNHSLEGTLENFAGV